MTADRYVLHHQGTWFLHIGYLSTGERIIVDGRPADQTQHAGWVATDHEPVEVVKVGPPQRQRVRYRLTEGMAPSERFPAELTIEDYVHRTGEDSTTYDAAVASVYEAEWETLPAVVTPIEGPWLRLDGEPPPVDGHSWVASLPYALQYRTEYLHLFSGYLTGFPEAVAAAINKALGLVGLGPAAIGSAYVKHGTTEVHLAKRVPFDPPVTKPVRAGRRWISEERTVTRYLDWKVPARIAGATRAEACAEWDRRIAEIVAEAKAATAAACGHCQGRGYISIDGPGGESR
jgi:hypothetical protein